MIRNKLLGVICDAFGLPPETRAVRLTCEVGSLSEIEAEIVVRPTKEVPEFQTELRRYELVQILEPPLVSSDEEIREQTASD